jgi:uncharacterized RDD family membrane protein YckC
MYFGALIILLLQISKKKSKQMENQYLDSNIDQPSSNYSEYASFWRRLGATMIDGLLVGAVNNVLQSVSGVGKHLQEVILEDPSDIDIQNIISIAGPIWALGIGIQIAYFAYFESSEKQATFGKQALGLVVTDMNGDRITFGKAVIRYFAKFLSALILMIGYIMQPFTEKKQALHDMIAGTLVFKK